MALDFNNKFGMKPVLGAYAAMARNNVYLTVMDIMDQLHIRQTDITDKEDGKKVDLESHIWRLDLFPRNHQLLPEQEARASRLLRHHFPFLDLSDDLKDVDNEHGASKQNNTYEDLCKTFLGMVTVLTHLRDMNLHYKINDDKITDYYFRRAEKVTGYILRDVLKAAPRKIKDRYKGTALLDESSMLFFTDGNYTRQGRKFTFNPRWAFNPQRQPLPSETKVLQNGSPVIDRNTGRPRQFERLSSFGEILFVALFTEKRYIPDLLRDSGLDDNFMATGENGKMSQQRIIREIISAYSIRLPERKLDIETGETQVMLDMLNELARCPSELFDVLPEYERRSFEIMGSDGTQVLMKRYSDRYVPLVLRYFDSVKEFKKIRFQVNTGLLRYEHHGPKEYMDGVARPRVVQSGINGFGRIQEMEAARTAGDTYLGFPILETDEEGNATEMPYITDSAARYVLNGDLIGLSLNGDAAPKLDAFPNGSGLKYKVRCPQPDCWLSRYELPALSFYTYLARKYHISQRAEDIIDQTVRQYRNFFAGVADGSITSMVGIAIPRKNISEKLLAYLDGEAEVTDFKKYKEGVVAKMLHETETLLSKLDEDMKVIGTKDNRIGKRSYVRIRPGKLAEFIAEDIVRFQEHPSGKPEKKLTGQQYSILQGMIATFHEGLTAACRNAGLLNGDSSHPFLSKVFTHHGQGMASTVDFYRAYLEERRAYLKDGVPDDASFLHANRKKWLSNKDSAYYQALALRYIKDEKTGEKVGVFLPRGLFDKAVLDIIREHCPKTRAIIDASERANMAFIILTYLENELEDQNQGFYFNEERLKEYGFSKVVNKEKDESGMRRLSRILRLERDAKPSGLYYNALKEESRWKDDHINGGPLDKGTKELSEKLRQSYKRMCENEKAIRRYMVQDITLFLLARSLVRVAGNSVNLCSVGPKGNGILDQRVDVTTRYKKYLITQNDIKIKDYGEIYKLLKDRRIDTLLQNQKKQGLETIDLEEIKEELVTYNRKRVPMVSSIQEYEKGVYEENTDYFDGMTGRIDFKTVVEADGKSSPLVKAALKVARNAVSHNQYPNRVVEKEGHSMELYSSELPDMAKDIAKTVERLSKYSSEIG